MLHWYPERPSASLVDYRSLLCEELIVRILNSAAIIKNSPDKVRNATRAVHTRATKCLEVEGGIFENLMAN